MPSRPHESALRKELVAACRRLAEVRLIGAAEGNVSLRLAPGRVLTTPSGLNKAHLTPDDLVVTNDSGALLVGLHSPSSEQAMHLAIYAARPDVGAIVHAHPPAAIALTLAGLGLEAPLVPEMVTALGPCVPTAPYASPSTVALAESVANALGTAPACLMERHGALAVGDDVFQACDRIEAVERIAQVTLMAYQAGGRPQPLPQTEVVRLLQLSGRLAAR